MTNQILVFSAPGTCSRVPTIALEEVGEEFESRTVRFMSAEHKSEEYKRFNPKGKVPALVFNGETLTENVAIAMYLAGQYPDAELMPQPDSDLERSRQIADLCFCSATLHPIVTRIRVPQMFAGKENAKAVYTAGCKAMQQYFQLIEERLTGGPWWYGEKWSIMDAYLYWGFWRIDGADFETAKYPLYSDHAKRMEARPAVQRALVREDVMTAELEKESLVFTPTKPE